MHLLLLDPLRLAQWVFRNSWPEQLTLITSPFIERIYFAPLLDKLTGNDQYDLDNSGWTSLAKKNNLSDEHKVKKCLCLFQTNVSVCVLKSLIFFSLPGNIVMTLSCAFF